MGGRALKNTYTRRYDRDEFKALESRIVETLKKTFTDVKPTLYYSEKDSFGDLDVLVLNDGKDINIKEYIQETFNPSEMFINGGVYSFDVEEFQIDFIYVPKRNWITTYHYMSYNDLHNFIGKIARQFGCKWGQFGLKWVGYNESRNKIGEIILTKDLKTCLEFLGFDHDRYTQGFKNLEEIFEYVRSCKYYNPYYFDFELMNKVNRQRDEKRTTYTSFIEYIKEDKNNSELTTSHRFFKDKTLYLGHINTHFPHFFREYKDILDKEAVRREMRGKFNGNLIMRFMENKGIELKGKPLGDAINKFKRTFRDHDEYVAYIIHTPEPEIYDKFYQIYNS